MLTQCSIDKIILPEADRSTLRKTYPSAILTTTNATWTGLEMNLSLNCKWLVTLPQPWFRPTEVVPQSLSVQGALEHHN